MRVSFIHYEGVAFDTKVRWTSRGLKLRVEVTLILVTQLMYERALHPLLGTNQNEVMKAGTVSSVRELGLLQPRDLLNSSLKTFYLGAPNLFQQDESHI
jgi:hypothetical protein